MTAETKILSDKGSATHFLVRLEIPAPFYRLTWDLNIQFLYTAFDWYAGLGLLIASPPLAFRMGTGLAAGARSASRGPFRAQAIPGPSQARVAVRPRGRLPHTIRRR